MARGRNPWILVVLMILGGLAGSVAGRILSPTFPFLDNMLTAELAPGVLDLQFMTVTFGFSVSIGPLTLFGFLLGYLVYRNI